MMNWRDKTRLYWAVYKIEFWFSFWFILLALAIIAVPVIEAELRDTKWAGISGAVLLSIGVFGLFVLLIMSICEWVKGKKNDRR